MHEKSKALQYLMELKNKRSHENMSSEVYGKSLSVFVYLLIFFSSCVCVAVRLSVRPSVVRLVG